MLDVFTWDVKELIGYYGLLPMDFAYGGVSLIIWTLSSLMRCMVVMLIKCFRGVQYFSMNCIA